LRGVDVHDLPVENSVARLRHFGYQLCYGSLLTGKSYLRFDALFEDSSELKGLIDAAKWLTQSLPSVEGIDWCSLDQHVLYSLIHTYPLTLELVNQHAKITKISVIELVTDTSGLTALPQLATSNGNILVQQYNYGKALEISGSTPRIDNRLQADLEFLVGYSTLPRSSLPTVEIGDVLLVENVAEFVRCNGKNLFKYTLTQGSIMLNEHNENEEQYEAAIDKLSANEPAGIDALPIQLSFVLMEKSVTLGELKAMAPGELVEIPAAQVMKVEIRANQRKFGCGELVQLPNGQLAVEVRQILS